VLIVHLAPDVAGRGQEGTPPLATNRIIGGGARYPKSAANDDDHPHRWDNYPMHNASLNRWRVARKYQPDVDEMCDYSKSVIVFRPAS
jgi:hypothetical protein